MNGAELRNIEPDYIHSSNAVFHFMKKAEYLEDALLHKRVYPRYCEENVGYLNLEYENERIEKICVLQKCFCDIPLHNIAKCFPVTVLTDVSDWDKEDIKGLERGSTHADFYGGYGISFSKKWALDRNLQPVQYINSKASLANQFRDSFDYAVKKYDIDEIIASDIISRLSYFKPVQGEMTRTFSDKAIRVVKNFHDECEWRYVPSEETLDKKHITSVIFDKETQKIADRISDRLADEEFRNIWLQFGYQDIRYIIVPDNESRIKMIKYIMELKIESEDELQEKYILISKILVLDDIKRDF